LLKIWVIDDIIEGVIVSINEKFNEMYDVGIENGISSDFCYGLKSLAGMYFTKGQNVDASLNVTIRCSAYNKYLESLKSIHEGPKQIWVDIPPRNLGNSVELLTDNISNALNEFEKLTGNKVSDNDLRAHFKIGNQVKRSYKNIIYDISASDFYPCNPLLSLQSRNF